MERFAETFASKPLKVLFLSNTGGWKGNFCPGLSGEICTNGTGDGPMLSFLKETLNESGIRMDAITEMDTLVVDQG